MIVSFRDAATMELFTTRRSRKWASIAKVALRKLDQLELAESLDEMSIPPANRLEALKGQRKGQYSVRINLQFRICFRWQDGAHDVEIVDYH